MIKCEYCRTENLDDSQYCDECGAKLSKHSENSAAAPVFKAPENPVFRSGSVTSIGIPPMVEELKSKSNSFAGLDAGKAARVKAKLVIERGESIGTEFQIRNGESNIGRWDADNGIFPDVDLDKHDPEAKVSRRHARIIFENGKFSIEDLGSTNGTFVNRGRRLLPGNPHLLTDGDEIIVGKTFLRFKTTE